MVFAVVMPSRSSSRVRHDRVPGRQTTRNLGLTHVRVGLPSVTVADSTYFWVVSLGLFFLRNIVRSDLFRSKNERLLTLGEVPETSAAVVDPA